MFLLFQTQIFSGTRRNEKELIEADSWIYGALTAVTLENGQLELVDSTPLTVGQIKSILSRLDYENLSKAGKKYVDEIEAYFEEENFSVKAGIFSMGIEPELNLEGYYKSSDSTDWVYDRYSRKPLVFFPVTITADNYAFLKLNAVYEQNKGFMNHLDNYINIPYKSEYTNINFPDISYLSTGLDFAGDSSISFRMGQGPQSIGRTLTGSIILSEYLTGAAYANLQFLSQNFKFNTNVIELNVDRYFYSHSFDLVLFNQLDIFLMEGILVNAPLELRYLNPWTVFHGMSPWLDYGRNDYHVEGDPESHVCCYFGVKLNYTPVKNVRIYGMYSMTQLQTKFERDNWPDDTTPNGQGFQLGAEAYIPFNEGYVHLWAEGVYTDPYLYIKQDPNWSLVRTYRENIGDFAVFYEWLGSPLGPDTIAGQLNAGYEVPGKWGVTLSYQFKACGEYSGTKVFKRDGVDWGGVDFTTGTQKGEGAKNDSTWWVYPDRGSSSQSVEEAKRRQALIAPSGIPEYVNTIACRINYSVSPEIKINFQPAYTFIFNRNNVEGEFVSGPEFALSMTLRLTKMLKGGRHSLFSWE